MVPGEEKALKYLQGKGFSVGASYLITDAIKKDLDVDLFASLDNDYSQMRVIKTAMEDGKDVSIIIGRNYSAAQMETVLKLLEEGLYDVSAVNPEYTCTQMRAVARSIKSNIDRDIFIQNAVVADYYDVVLPFIQLHGMSDFSWIRSDMSEKFVQLILEMMVTDMYSQDLLILSEQELIREYERLKAEARDREKFNKKNLARFKVFSDYK